LTSYDKYIDIKKTILFWPISSKLLYEPDLQPNKVPRKYHYMAIGSILIRGGVIFTNRAEGVQFTSENTYY